MKCSKGVSPLRAIVILSAYLGGIITVAILSCDDVFLAGETDYANASFLPDGGEQLPDLSVLAFVFEEGTEEITGVTASVHEGSSEVILNEVKLYRISGAILVVEVKAKINRSIRPHFYFLNREGEVVQEYRVHTYVDQSLITYTKQSFGEKEEPLYHDQPAEIKAEIGDTPPILLKNKRQMWVNGKFHDLWRVVKLPPDSYATSPSDLVNSDQPSIVGIAGGTEGDIVSLEVLSE